MAPTIHLPTAFSTSGPRPGLQSGVVSFPPSSRLRSHFLSSGTADLALG